MGKIEQLRSGKEGGRAHRAAPLLSFRLTAANDNHPPSNPRLIWLSVAVAAGVVLVVLLKTGLV